MVSAEVKILAEAWGIEPDMPPLWQQADQAIREFEELSRRGVSEVVARQQAAVDSPLAGDKTVAEHAIDQYTHLLTQDFGRDESRQHATAVITGALAYEFDDDADLYGAVDYRSEEKETDLADETAVEQVGDEMFDDLQASVDPSEGESIDHGLGYG